MADNISTLAPIASLPDEREWGTIFNMAQQLVPTGFLPEGINTPQKAAAILLKGRELGIPPMQALANIAIIKGKPTVQAELMMAMVKRAYGRDAIWVEETTDTFAKVGYLVHGKPRFYSYTIDMAEKAGLTKNQTWQAHRPAMLRARTISAVCRMEFPEVIGGMYVAGELGEPVKVDDATGEVTSYDYDISDPKTPVSHASPLDRLLDVAKGAGISEEDLELQATTILKKASLEDVLPADLRKLTEAIESRPDNARAFYQELRAKAGKSEVMAQINAEIEGGSVDDTEPEVDPDTGEIIPPAGSVQGELIDLPTPSRHGTD